MQRSPLAITSLCAMLVSTSLAVEMKREKWGATPEGATIEQFTLTSSRGGRVRVMTWGATLAEVSVPDRQGAIADVTLGFDALDPYLKPHPFFGSIAGRYANRIALGRFTLDGKTYTLATNNGANHLHGGRRGFDKRNWKVDAVTENSVRLSYVSPDGEEGYGGQLTASVTYAFSDDHKLTLSYEARTDAPTVLNLTNHAYWNLGSQADVLGHELGIKADKYTVVNEQSIPTGELRPVEGSAFDFRTAKPIGRDIEAMKDSPGGGFDHNWVLAMAKREQPELAAELYDPSTGRVMRVLTDQPGVQFYTGNYLKNVSGKGGRTYGKHAGLCLETQHFPDSPNQPTFPSTVLRPGETFRSTTVFEFGVR